jgi:hypothetical protein
MGSSPASRYYDDFGAGHDCLLRCADCRKLILYSYLVEHGMCKCGNRRVKEITTMSGREWFKVWSGLIRFPYRKEFLSEFPLPLPKWVARVRGLIRV